MTVFLIIIGWLILGFLGWGLAIYKHILFRDEPEFRFFTVVFWLMGPITLFLAAIDGL